MKSIKSSLLMKVDHPDSVQRAPCRSIEKAIEDKGLRRSDCPSTDESGVATAAAVSKPSRPHQSLGLTIKTRLSAVIDECQKALI
jgi:hypothetical protein